MEKKSVYTLPRRHSSTRTIWICLISLARCWEKPCMRYNRCKTTVKLHNNKLAMKPLHSLHLWELSLRSRYVYFEIVNRVLSYFFTLSRLSLIIVRVFWWTFRLRSSSWTRCWLSENHWCTVRLTNYPHWTLKCTRIWISLRFVVYF